MELRVLFFKQFCLNFIFPSQAVHSHSPIFGRVIRFFTVAQWVQTLNESRMTDEKKESQKTVVTILKELCNCGPYTRYS